MTDDPQTAVTEQPATAVPVEAPETAEYVLPEDADWEGERWEDDPATSAVPPRPRRKLVTPASIVLAGVVVAGLGFIGGVQVQKHAGDGGGAAGEGGMAAMAGMRGGAGAAGSGSSAAAGTTVGEVANVKGSTLYVTGADGTTVEVRVGSHASVQRLAESSAKGVRPGDAVVVQGTTRSDGGVTATAVQAIANGLSLNLGGLRPGGAGAAAGGGAGSGSGSGGSGSGSGESGSNSSGSSGSGSADVDQLFGGGG